MYGHVWCRCMGPAWDITRALVGCTCTRFFLGSTRQPWSYVISLSIIPGVVTLYHSVQ